jgi:hypothetical protein
MVISMTGHLVDIATEKNVADLKLFTPANVRS